MYPYEVHLQGHIISGLASMGDIDLVAELFPVGGCG